jgi:hypothetical protein
MKVQIVQIGEEPGFFLPDEYVATLEPDQDGLVAATVEDGTLVLHPASPAPKRTAEEPAKPR